MSERNDDGKGREKRSRTRALWVIAVAMAALAIGVGCLLWLRLTGKERAEAADRPETEAVAQSPLHEIATAVGIGEDDCGLDTAPSSDHRLTGLPSGKSPIANPRGSFSLAFQDEVSPYSLMAAFVLPGQQVELQALFTHPPTRLHATVDEGKLDQIAPDRWRWTAPQEPGTHCIRVEDLDDKSSSCLEAFVMVPYQGEATLNGYQIGHYERTPLKGLPVYNVPAGLVEVTEKNLDTWVSPHFQLRQFVAKQSSNFPKYMVLRTRLLLKLEMVLERLRERGVTTDALYVMSGYRTPYYNAAIGNKTTYSRHSYGDAADVFVDRNRDGRMDDINGDGKSDIEDARLIYAMLDGFSADAWYHQFEGGLGLYPPNPRFGPMVHMDTRGVKARWMGAG